MPLRIGGAIGPGDKNRTHNANCKDVDLDIWQDDSTNCTSPLPKPSIPKHCPLCLHIRPPCKPPSRRLGVSSFAPAVSAKTAMDASSGSVMCYGDGTDTLLMHGAAIPIDSLDQVLPGGLDTRVERAGQVAGCGEGRPEAKPPIPPACPRPVGVQDGAGTGTSPSPAKTRAGGPRALLRQVGRGSASVFSFAVGSR